MAGAMAREILRMLKSLQFNRDSPLFEIGFASLACAQIRGPYPSFAWVSKKVTLPTNSTEKNSVFDQTLCGIFSLRTFRGAREYCAPRIGIQLQDD